MNPCRPLLRGAVAALALTSVSVFATVDEDPYTTATDEDFFAKIDLSREGLSGPNSVAEAVAIPDYVEAKKRLLAYFVNRPGKSYAPVLTEFVGAADALLTDDLNHQYTYYGHTHDVDDPAHNPTTNPINANYPFGDVEWKNPDDTATEDFPFNWVYQLVRFDYMPRVVADWINKGRPQTGADAQQINNVITMGCDFIVDVSLDGAKGYGYGGKLQTALRLQNWTRCYFEFLKAPETVTIGSETFSVAEPERMIGLLKEIWEMANFTANNGLEIYNNRRFTQAKALHMVATYFPEFFASGQWLDTSDNWTSVYLVSNLHRNGALAEPAPGYHGGQTTALANMQTLALNNGEIAYDLDGDKLVGRMLTYWGDLVQPNGKLVLLGDSNQDADHASIEAIAEPLDGRLPRQDIRYITSSAMVGKPPGHTSISYGHGATVMRTGWASNDRMAFIENQPPANHSHPDNLAFSLYGYGQSLILNSGRNSYENADTIANWHDSETEANSTVQIDSRPAKSFAQRTNSWITQGGFDYYDGESKDALASGIPPTDDTYIHHGNPDENFNGETVLKIRNHNDAPNFYDCIAYLKFRPGNVLETLSSATLKLYCTQASAGNTVRINVYGLRQGTIGIAEDWNELNATWDTKSRNHDPDEAIITGVGTDALDLGYIDVSATGWYSFSTTELRDFIANETASGTRGQITFALTNDNEDNKLITFATRLSSYRPALQLATSSGPWGEVITHRRKIFSDRNNLYIISDLLTGASKNHQYEQLWGLNPTRADSGAPSINTTTGKATATFANAVDGPADANVQIVTADRSSLSAAPILKDGWVTFDVDVGKVDNQRVAYTRTGTGTVTFDTAILAGDGSIGSDFRVERIGAGAPTSVATAMKVHLNYGVGDIVYYYLCHGSKTLRTFDIYQTDGEMVSIKTNQSGVVRTVSLKSANRVLHGGNPLVDLVGSGDIADLHVDYGTSGKLILTSSKPLQQEIALYSASTITAIEFNGESIPFTNSGSIYTINRKLLFSDDFENGAASRWTQSGTGAALSVTTITGDNVLEQAVATVEELGNPVDAQAVAGESSWSNYVVEAKLQIAAIHDNSNRVGLVARHIAAGDCYWFVYDRYPGISGDEQGKLRIYKKVGGTVTSLAVKNYMLHLGSTYTFRATLDGTSLKFFVNNKEELAATDSSLVSGRAGVIADRADVWFDDFTVTGGAADAVTSGETLLAQGLPPSGNTYVGINGRYLNLFDHFFGDSDALLGTQTHPSDAASVTNRVAYIKFPMANYKGKGSSITGAVMRLYGYSRTYATSDVKTTISIYAIPDVNWNSRQATWENRPGQGSATLVATITDVEDPSWYEAASTQLTNYLDNHRNDDEVAFMIVAESNGLRVDFFSDVYAPRPELILMN